MKKYLLLLAVLCLPPLAILLLPELAHAADEDERTLVCCTLDEHFFTVITFSYIVECIRHYNKFVLVV